MTVSIRQLRDKLCRELAQSEQSAAVHCEREARRYGAHPPGHVLRAIASHAREMRAPLSGVIEARQPFGARVGRAVGEAFSAIRHFAADRVIDAERSYRATLLGVRHGLDVARLLHEVLLQQQDARGARTCDLLIDQRSQLVVDAEAALRWFARNPDVALHSSTSIKPQLRLS